MSQTLTSSRFPDPDTRCLARSVVATLSEEPALEAVTIDRAQQKISLATLGRTDVGRLTERLTEKLRQAQEAATDDACGLLTGHGSCEACATPLSAQELQNITIKSEGDATTIARSYE